MHLHSLELSQFRNLAPQLILLPDRKTVFVGRNGQGKTSILEAVSILAFGRSFRTGSRNDWVAWGNGRRIGCHVAGECEAGYGSFSIRYEIRNGVREVSLNGHPISAASEFFGRLKVVEFSPDDQLIVKDEPAVRRQFLNRVLAMVEPQYVPTLVQYQRALRHRNVLLHQWKKGEQRSKEQVTGELASWTEILIAKGRAVQGWREKLVREIGPLVDHEYTLLSATERVEVGYETPCGTDLERQYEAALEQDLRLGVTTVGVHRDDLALRIDTGSGWRDARRYASQGQVRSLVLALKLAALEVVRLTTGESPILLLDDVDSELDSERKHALIGLVTILDNQVLLTTTDPHLGQQAGVVGRLTVESGVVRCEE